MSAVVAARQSGKPLDPEELRNYREPEVDSKFNVLGDYAGFWTVRVAPNQFHIGSGPTVKNFQPEPTLPLDRVATYRAL